MAQHWIAHYLYETDDGRTRARLLRIDAPDREQAEAIARRNAPAPAYAVTLHAESDERFLQRLPHAKTEDHRSERPTNGLAFTLDFAPASLRMDRFEVDTPDDTEPIATAASRG